MRRGENKARINTQELAITESYKWKGFQRIGDLLRETIVKFTDLKKENKSARSSSSSGEFKINILRQGPTEI